MYFTVYRTVNKINCKIYIGKHKTKNLDDSYMGSGKLLCKAIEKYGLHNFEKEILFIFDNEQEMNNKEAELVTTDFCLREDTYNLHPGGKGGWSYFNSYRDYNDVNYTSKISIKTKQRHINNQMNISGLFYGSTKETNGMLGKKHSEETKNKMSKSGSGQQNSQFGTMWITNGLENKKIKNTDVIPEGWNKGRK